MYGVRPTKISNQRFVDNHRLKRPISFSVLYRTYISYVAISNYQDEIIQLQRILSIHALCSFFSIEPIRRFQLSLTFVFISLRNFEVTRLWDLNQRFKHCYCDFRSTISFISVSLRYSFVAETDDISTYPSWVTFRILSYSWWHIKWRVTGHRGDVECRHEHFLPPSDPNRVSLEYEYGLEATFYPKIVCLSNCLGEHIVPSSSSPPIAAAACQIMISVNS